MTAATLVSRSGSDRRAEHDRAAQALTRMVRATLTRAWGVRIARVCAWLLAAGTLGCLAVIARSTGPDAAVLTVVARASAALAICAGGVGALSLSAPPKDVALSAGVAALASARGLAPGVRARADLMATIRIVGELVVLPVTVVVAIVIATAGRARLGPWAFSLFGAEAFSALAALVLGVVAYACRRWGGPAGRHWFLALVLLPWIVAEAGLGGAVASWLSIPGALGELWQTLTAAVGS